MNIAIIKIIHHDIIHLQNVTEDAVNKIRTINGEHEVQIEYTTEKEEGEMQK